MMEPSLWNQDLLAVRWALVVVVALVAAVTDLAARRIPNWLTLPAAALGIAAAFLIGGLTAGAESLGAAALLAAPYVFLFVFAGGGAGDAKLMAALGAWLGLSRGAVVLVAVCLAGVALAIVFAALQKRLRPVLANVAGALRVTLVAVSARGRFAGVAAALPPAAEMQTVPYGVAIFSGVFCAAIGAFLT